MTNCIIAQSGGPTSVINASLSGIIKAAITHKKIDIVYGSLNGIHGIINDRTINLSELFEPFMERLEILKTTPAMYLGSCRHKLKSCEADPDTYRKIFDFFTRHHIHYFFYIGGNDSMDTVAKLDAYAKRINYPICCIGIPKTIDNDLIGTDHTPGFGSAAKFVATTLLEIAHDAYIYDMQSVTIIEIMGRNAGWLTAASALARNTYNTSPDLIYLPEVSFKPSQFIQDIQNLQKQKKQIIIAVSEGIKNEDGNYIASSNTTHNDLFGHAALSGVGKALEQIIKNTISCKVRSIELNVLQRSAVHIASKTDIEEAFEIGRKAVQYALRGITGHMMVINRIQNHPYQTSIESIDVNDVANKEKVIPKEWLHPNGNDVTLPLLNYLKPLIKGEAKIDYKDGIPQYISHSHLSELSRS